MTTFEHAMLGANGVIAAGLHRQYGWHLVVLASVCAIAPDWDGLVILYDVQIFDQGHRVWGHNLLACVLAGVILATIDYRFDVFGNIAERLADAVVSSGHGLSDWPLNPFWPFSDQEFIYPMVRWGDPGITLIFCSGMIAMARWRDKLQPFAISTLLAVLSYVLIRGNFDS